MTWRTHVVVGMNTLWILPLTGHVDNTIFTLVPTAALASLLPDIDAISAKIHYLGKGALLFTQGKFKGKYFHHRGMMHGVFIAALITLILAFFFAKSVPMLPVIFFLAYMSHGVVDGLNWPVGLFYPLWMKKFTLLPRSLLTPVNGFADNLIFILGSFSLLLLFWVIHNQFPII